MAKKPASSADDYNITVLPDSLSGSVDYVHVKQLAAVGDDINRNTHSSTIKWFDMIGGNARAIDSMVAAVAQFNPWAVQFIPRLSVATDYARKAVMSSLQMWDTTQREISEHDWLHSPEHANNMIQYGRLRPSDKEVNETLNGHFFTHNKDGSLNKAKAQEVQHVFDPSHPEMWPNLILTSSHALVRGHTDISGTMKGFHALIMHSFGDGANRAPDLPLIRRTDRPDQADDVTDKQTIILSSVHNDHNAWVNGGNLLMRLHQLDGLYESEKRGEIKTQKQLEKSYIDGMSPAAIQLSKLILSLIVEEPDSVRTDTKAPIIIEPKKPLHLRADASQVLQHIKLVGYSKGGNIVTDAARHLILQLQHDGAVLAPRSFDPVASANSDYIPINNQIIGSLMHNLGVLAVNPGICPLTDREKSLGIRRISIRNNLDRISAHLFRKHDREDRFGTHDDVYVVNGKSMGDLGHGMEGSLGTRTKPGYLIDESKVAPSDIDTLQLVRSRLQAFFASCYNQIGISHVHDDPSKSNELGIEFSTGVSEHQIEKSSNAITKAMEHAGFTNVSMACAYDAQRRCHLRFDRPASIADRQKMLGEALNQLHEKTPNIFVAGTCFQEIGMDAHAPRAKKPAMQISTPVAERDRLDLTPDKGRKSA